MEGLSATPPTLPPDVPQVFLPPTVTFEWALREYEEQSGRPVLTQERRLVYAPRLLALGAVRMLDRKRGVDIIENVARLAQVGEGPGAVDWDAGRVAVDQKELSPKPLGEGVYAPVGAALARPRDLKRLAKDFGDYAYYNVSTTILYSPALDLYGKVGESRRDFRVRCEEEARLQRDAELKKARVRVEKEMERVQKKLRREQRELDQDQDELEARKREEMLSLGESAFNLLTRRRSSSVISRASRKRRMSRQAKSDVEESEATIDEMEEQLEDLKDQWEEQAAEIADLWAEKLEEIQEFEVKPRRADVTVEFCGLAWSPVWQVTLEDGRRVDLPAREA